MLVISYQAVRCTSLSGNFLLFSFPADHFRLCFSSQIVDFPDKISFYVMGCVSFYKSSRDDIKASAALFTGKRLSTVNYILIQRKVLLKENITFPLKICSFYKDKTRQDLFYSAQFYRTFRLKLQRQLNTVQLRNKRKKKNVTIN